MLMRYTVVALLFAALTASAVRAQSPPRKSPPSAQPEGQGWVEVPVNPRPDAPLRLSVQVSRIADARWPSADWGHFRFRSSVENISHQDIGLVTTRNEAVGYDRRAGGPGGHSRLPGFYSPGKALRPGQVDVVEPPMRLLPSIWVSRLTVEVESVVFMDGTVWCIDECRIAQYEAGNLAGGRAAVGRLLKVLEQGGLDAPVPAVTVTTGELVDIKPPPGHSKEWEEGFLGTTKFVADTLWRQYVLYGTGQIERTLRNAYRVEGEK
jgi:hypothetical protein